jgi:gamma-tubulin complex component 2
LKDEQLIARLRSLKRYFFLSQSFFLTHLLDLSLTELRKASRSASIVKLQSLLDIALNTDAHGEDTLYREDVKVTMADTGLYDFLLKVVNVQGLGGRGEEGIEEGTGHHAQEEQKKEKDDKKLMLGEAHLTLYLPRLLIFSRSY